MKEDDRPDPSFLRDVREGLRSSPKTLKSKYFYDAKGDALFQRIMELDEYYPARAENAILRDQGSSIKASLLKEHEGGLDLVEFGAGDASKTRHLLGAFSKEERRELRYRPNDISPDVLRTLQENLKAELPDLEVDPLQGDHSELLGAWKREGDRKQVFLFLGGNIGNYGEGEGDRLLKAFAGAMEQGDRLLIGLDLHKDPRRILAAYDDQEGVTRDFNLNLLERMNRELGADFDIGSFVHHPLYDPVTREARSYLISTREQEVFIESLGESFHFHAWEPIFMERSRKFTRETIAEMAERTGFRVEKYFTDPEGDFLDSVWRRV